MIAALSGTLVEKGPERLVVETRDGVGYLVHVSQQTSADLPATGTAVRLLVHTEVREDAIELFGFITAAERALFHLLRKVKGLGPRTSLAVLSGMPPATLIGVIAAGDVPRLQTIPGVGRRFAERIVVECREAATAMAVGVPTVPLGTPGDAALDEAVSALVNLGYKRAEAEQAVKKIRTPSAPVEVLIRAALQGLAG
jgi:Holliday junction DNA helicase RuvA